MAALRSIGQDIMFYSCDLLFIIYYILEEPILHLLWGLVDTFFGYNFPNPEPIWMKSGI